MAAPAPAVGEDLTRAMVGIGMVFAGEGARDPNVEDTLVAASEEGMVRDDLRTLSVLVTWLEVHHAFVNVDRLTRLVRAQGPGRVTVFWCAVARWLGGDARWRRLAEGYAGPRVDLLSTGTDFLVRRRGEDPRFAEGPLRVPVSTLRSRHSDVLEPAVLARRHRAYRWRVVIGPTYRADMWAALEAEPSLSAAALARCAYGSFATAWRVRRDWHLVHGR